MALIKLNIDSLKKESKGVLNKLVDNVVNKIEDKLENAVEDLFAKALKKVGLSDSIARQLSARFGDAFSSGLADKFFQSSTSEQDRVSPQDICENVLPRDGAETTGKAVDRLSYNNRVAGKAVNQYPAHLGEYYFSMKFADYVRPAPQAKGELKFTEAFVLPLPRELKESFDIKVSEKDQGMAGGIADAATAYFTEGSNFNTAQAAQTLLLSKLVQASGEFGDAIGQFAGAVPNPHVAAIFSGVSLRTHRFEWTFAPRNADESATLQDIIWKLKSNALPSYSTNGTAALQYPQLVQIDLYPWAGKDNDPDRLIRFKPCMLSDVSINYSPQGIPSFFHGTRRPTFIQLSLEFLETEIWTSNAYGRQGNDRIDDIKKLLAEAVGVDIAAVEREANEIFNQKGDGTGPAVDAATATTASQTPGRTTPVGSTSSSSTPAPPKIAKQNEAVKQQIAAMPSGSARQITATNPDQKGVTYTVSRNASTTGKTTYSDGSKLVKTAGKYTVDFRTKNGSTYRAGEFANATAAYNDIVSRGAF
jgi:hypothetical protein